MAIYIFIGLVFLLFVIAIVYGRLKKRQWEKLIVSKLIEAQNIEKDASASYEERKRRIISCFKSIGFKLTGVEGNILNFEIPSKGVLYKLIMSFGWFIQFGPFYSAFIAGDNVGRGEVGRPGEKLSYRIDFG